jgi:hypothetical protein
LFRTGGFCQRSSKEQEVQRCRFFRFFLLLRTTVTYRSKLGSLFFFRTADQGSMYPTLTHHLFFLQIKERTTSWHWVKLETSVVLANRVQPGYMVRVSILVLKNLAYESGMTLRQYQPYTNINLGMRHNKLTWDIYIHALYQHHIGMRAFFKYPIPGPAKHWGKQNYPIPGPAMLWNLSKGLSQLSHPSKEVTLW